jgi:predicted nucleic acid-binding Zn ribbon protein
MRIYEYRRPDGTTFEIQQSFSDETLTHDPETGVEVKRVLHAPAVHFKGKGFYNTDYGTRNRQRENAANAEGSSSSDGSSAKGDGGSSESSSSSSETKSSESSSTTDAKQSDGGAAKQDGAKKSKDAKPAAAKT